MNRGTAPQCVKRQNVPNRRGVIYHAQLRGAEHTQQQNELNNGGKQKFLYIADYGIF